MAYLDHIRACNAWTPEDFRPFRLGGQQIGWVRHHAAALLEAFPEVFTVTDDAVALADGLDTPEARTAAVQEVAEALAARGVVQALRGEMFPVKNAWCAPELFQADRFMVPFLGMKAYGVHLNGYVRHGDGSMSLWIGRRAADKAVAPNKLDNIVAGGQPSGLSLRDNLCKEAAEEAAMPQDLAVRAVSAGAITYTMEAERGLKPDTMYVHDLELPEDFVPINTDGELAEFVMMPVEDVLARVRDTDDFKFNVNLVIIDFALRHGLITPDDEPAYEALLKGLRGTHPGLDG